MTTLVKNNQTALLQEVWRRAFREGVPLEFTFPTPQHAQRAKFALYTAVRGVKDGTRDADAILAAAVGNCQVRAPRGGLVVIVERCDVTPVMQGFASGMAVAPGTVMPDATELAMKELEQRLGQVDASPTEVDPLVKKYY